MNDTAISTRARDIQPFIVMEVLERAKGLEAEGKDIVHLEVGEPDFPTPPPVKEAAVRALAEDDTHYTHSLGKLELREEICRTYWEKYRVDVSPDRVIVTSGTSPGMLLVFSALLDGTEEVIMPNPYYACYPNFVSYLGGRPVMVPVEEHDGFKYRIDKIKSRLSPSTRAVIVNSPANPTGTVFTARDYEAVADLGVMVVSDEIYSGLIYEGEEHTILEFTDRAFVIDGFSKRYAMTGWRLGWVIAPPEYVRPIQKMQQNLFICASSFAQEGGIAALRYGAPFVEEMVKVYDERRRYLLGRLRKMGIATEVEPTGAFYVLANVRQYTSDSYGFAFRILEEAGVAVTPGIDFGDNCEGYIRISYANALENIKTGMDRLEAFLQKV